MNTHNKEVTSQGPDLPLETSETKFFFCPPDEENYKKLSLLERAFLLEHTSEHPAGITLDSVLNEPNLLTNLKSNLDSQRIPTHSLKTVLYSDFVNTPQSTPVLAQPAYDFTVPGVHSFVANGLVVHNSTYDY